MAGAWVCVYLVALRPVAGQALPDRDVNDAYAKARREPICWVHPYGCRGRGSRIRATTAWCECSAGKRIGEREERCALWICPGVGTLFASSGPLEKPPACMLGASAQGRPDRRVSLMDVFFLSSGVLRAQK